MVDQIEFQEFFHHSSLNFVNYWADYVKNHASIHHKLDSEIANIFKALQKADEYEIYDLLLDTVHQVYSFCESRGLYREIEVYLLTVQPFIEKKSDSPKYIKNLTLLGRIALRNEAYATAVSYWEQGIVLAKEQDFQELLCDLERELGSLKTHLRDYDGAKVHLECGLKLAEALANDDMRCIFQGELCRLAYLTGDIYKAYSHCQKALTMAHRLEDPHRITGLLVYRGAIEESKGQLDEAFHTWQEGLKLARKVGNQERISFLLTNLGMIATKLGENEFAEAYLREGLELARKLGNTMVISHQLMDLGLLLSNNGKVNEALQYMRESILLAREIDDMPLLTYNLLKLGEYHLEQEEFGTANSVFSECLSLLDPLDQNRSRREKVATAYWGIARAIRELGSIENARRYGRKSLEILLSLEHQKSKEVRAWLDSLCL